MSSDLVLPLGEPPRVLAIGTGTHGPGVMRYRLAAAWQLHLYPYACRARIGGHDLDIRPGHAGLTPPGEDMRYELGGSRSHLYVHFTPTGTGTGAGAARLVGLGAAFPAAERTLAEAAGWQERAPARAAARVWDILWQVAAAAPAGRDDRLAADTRDLIEAHLGTRLRVAALAHRLGVSHSQLDRRFRAATGATVVGWIRARRAARARHLLQATDLPAAAIAREVGLPDLQALNKLMRRACGEGPRRLREAGRG